MENSRMDKRIKTLIVMHGSGIGGVETSITTLLKFLDRDSLEPLVVFPQEGPMKESIERMGIRTFVSPMEWMTPPYYLSRRNKEKYHFNRFLLSLDERVGSLVDIIRENGIDVVHTSTITVAEGALAARIAGVPHIWHIHGEYFDDDGFIPDRAVYSFVEEFSERVVAVSDSVKGFVSRRMTDEKKIEVIHNGVDLERFSAKKKESALFRDFPGLKGRKVAALIGMVYEIKGIELYVEAAIRAARENENTAFLVVGSESDRELAERMKERIKGSNLSDRIVFTGFRSDVPEILNDIDLLVCASLSEGFPYVVLESMAAGKPVVSTRCGGPEELVVDGETGYLVDKGDTLGLAEAIVKLLNDEKKMLLMGLNAGERIKNSFGAVRYARGFESLYRQARLKRPSGEGRIFQEFLLNSLSNLGSLGKRVSELEEEVRELKGFVSNFKNNSLYRTLKKVLK